MPSLENDIKRVNGKLQQLLKQYQQLQKEQERMTATIRQLEADKNNALQQVTYLQEQVAIFKSAAGRMSDSDKKAFDKKISQYIREIDKCITLLSE